MPRASRPLQAIFLMLTAMFGFACLGVGVRLLAPEMPSALMVGWRNVLSLPIVLVWSFMLTKGIPNFRTTRIKNHFWRASVGVVSMELWFYSLSVLPLTLATALSFTAPIFSTIFAIFFLGEKAGVRRWCAILAGFIGVLVILHPDTGSINIKALIVLLASAMMAVSGVLVKSLTRTEKPETIVFYMALFMIPWSIAPALAVWQPITWHQFHVLFWIAFFSTFAQLAMTRAFMRADMVTLMPFDFTRLIFVGILAYVFFGETMDGYTVMGALIIVASTVYIAHRETKKGKKRPELPPIG
jgi:drug/metabolite transporter (DMT)-like permease